MISFERLGYFGRLGNQMFQYASLIGFATHSNQPWGIPERNSKDTEIGGLGYKEKFVLDELFDLQYEKIISPTRRFMENGQLVKLPEDTDINGYFQSSNYFSHCEDEIRKQFTCRKEIQDRSNEYDDMSDKVSVHVRRGDYANLTDFHPLLGKEYYENAMSKFDGGKFIFMSDDIEWCKNTFGPEHSYAETNNMFVDFCLMTRCKGHIIANSSFSWWGAWLGKGKTVAPKKWFGPKLDYRNDGSIYEKEWTLC
jgi:hypothetical protein|tara:strand:- start:55 stop:813 length:759 start_codon:yes stop_codon:yes gene_type:complete